MTGLEYGQEKRFLSPDKEAVGVAMRLMALLAQTAPKSFGMDCPNIHIADDRERIKIVETMRLMDDKNLPPARTRIRASR